MPPSRNISRPSLSSERAQTTAEFALVLPLLALLLFGIIQFGIVFNNYVTLTDAVRAGARKAAVSRNHPDRVNVTKTAVKNSATGLDTSDAMLQIEVTPASNWDPGTDVTVQASYPYTIDLFGLVTVKDGRLVSKTTERVE